MPETENGLDKSCYLMYLNHVMIKNNQMTKCHEMNEVDILEAYRSAEMLGKTEFAEKLKVSRQRMHWWLIGKHKPTYEWLLMVVDRFEGWPVEMAQDILRARRERLQEE